MNLFKVYFQDRHRYFGKGMIQLIKGFGNPCFRHMVWLRICANTSLLNPIGFIARAFLKMNQVMYGFQIPHTTKIGKGLFLGHYGSIVINPNSVIGENCNISQGVTIGRVNVGDKKGSPNIGNRVWIGANSVLVGKISIGNDVFIAPLSFVNFDVPDNCMVIGNPGRIIENKSSEGYINSFS